jgi:hypothetical protein
MFQNHLNKNFNCKFDFSDQDWNFLNELFTTLNPISSHLEGDRRLNHYLERIYFYANRVMHRYCCSNVLNQLVEMFPQVNLLEFIC